MSCFMAPDASSTQQAQASQEGVAGAGRHYMREGACDVLCQCQGGRPREAKLTSGAVPPPAVQSQS